MSAELGELAGMAVGLVLTLIMFSYLLGDNALFRLAIHIFVGVAAGYVLGIAFHSVIWPRLFVPLLSGAWIDRLTALIPLLLSLMLLAKISPRFSALGSPVMALMVGVGAAVAVGGVVLGTVFPQILATVNVFDAGAAENGAAPAGLELVNGALILVGTVTSLAYFQFHARSPRPAGSAVIAGLGQVFIAIALGLVFAGVYAAALTALVERLHFIVDFIRRLAGV